MADAAPACDAPAPAASVKGSVSRPADPMALGNQYKDEFVSYAEGLRQRGTAYQELVQAQLNSTASQAEQLKQTIQEVVQDQSDVTTPTAAVLGIFSWAAVLTFGASLGFYLGANFLGGLVHLFFGGFFIALLTLVAMPLYVGYTLKSGGGGSDAEVRFLLLSVAIGSGVLLGAGFNSTYFYSEPIAFLTPLVVAAVFGFAAPALGNSRTTLLGASVGGAVGATFVIGLFTGSLSTSYLFLTLLYGGVAAFTLLNIFKFVRSETEPAHIYMLGYLVGYLYVKALTFFIMGSSEPYTDAPAHNDRK